MDEQPQNPEPTANPPIDHPVEPPIPQPMPTPPAQSTDTVINNQPPVKKSKKPFVKVMLGVIIGALLLLGGFYFATHKNNTTEVSPTPSPSEAVMTRPTDVMKPIASPSASVTKKTVTGGLTSVSSAFKTYAIEIPADWTDAKVTDANSDKLTVTKNDYSITITQGALGGGACTYKGDPPQQQAQSFKDFTDITGKGLLQFRRSWNTDASAQSTSYTICQKADDNSYSALTAFGRIDAKAPTPADAKTFAELDSIIASITKK